tara:strand:+ start:75698 stop:75865 length:168 start_codon:yes stop_codon:yes gene_type:complete
MQGIKIGHGSISSTTALGVKYIEPFMIIRDNPRKPIRKRFDQGAINFLVSLTWWN